MVSLTMEIETTRDIGRQILRHRSFSFQEFSQRYAAVGASYEERESRLQHVSDRQSSVEHQDDELKLWWSIQQDKIWNSVKKIYDEALERGVAKECARVVLPEGLTQTRMYMAGTLRSWVHYCTLRTTPGTQKEHRDIANEAKVILLDTFPSLSL
jgi:thymidylate synthase (FAD)